MGVTSERVERKILAIKTLSIAIWWYGMCVGATSERVWRERERNYLVGKLSICHKLRT